MAGDHGEQLGNEFPALLDLLKGNWACTYIFRSLRSSFRVFSFCFFADAVVNTETFALACTIFHNESRCVQIGPSVLVTHFGELLEKGKQEKYIAF